MSSHTLNLTPQLYDYLLDVSLRESPILEALRRETAEMPESNMQIAPDQGQFMALMAKILGAKKVIEVGTFTGYSSLCVAQALPAEGRVICCDVDETFTQVARRYWKEAGVDSKISLHLRPATQTLDELIAAGEQGSFDMAFIDADKVNYRAYYDRCLTLLRSGGVIMIDNVLWSGAVADDRVQDPDTQAIRALNKYLHTDQSVEISLLPVGDGLTLVRKK